MTELKIGGSDVVKIMYGSQEIGGATKLEPGTIIYRSKTNSTSFESAHLLSTTKNWSNLNGINIGLYISDFKQKLNSIDISSDDFKNLDTEKEYKPGGKKVIVSRSIVDGEYRLNVSADYYTFKRFEIKAI